MNPGSTLAASMWAMTAFSLILVALRLYTRIKIVRFVGVEDYMYTLTGASPPTLHSPRPASLTLFFQIFLLGFTIFIQISVHYGLGRSFWELSISDSSDAIFWTYVANTFAIIGNAMAKLSMGLFLLRVVQVRWHKIALWAAVAVTVTTSCVLTVMLWNQTDPVKASWDPLRTPGRWRFQIQPLSVGLGGMFSNYHISGVWNGADEQYSMVESVRFLLRHLSVALHLVAKDATTGEGHAC